MTIADDDQAVFGVTAERRWQSTRSAWCYGDPGAAVALSWSAPRCGTMIRSSASSAEPTHTVPQIYR